MKNYEIGTDIQKIEEFRELKKGFLDKIFTNSEQKYCSERSQPEQHLAARFAVKEAIIKAMSQFGERVNYKDVEIKMADGKPKLNIQTFLKKKYSGKISMSHSGRYALGFALIYRIRLKNGK